MSEDMDAPTFESSCSATSPKLPEGERVEVRQRDKGLRGSWHPATIVGLKPGRRIVEYDELLSDDGLCKLRESIPLTKCLQKASSPTPMSSPLVNTPSSSSIPTSSKKRGLLRPAPPVPTDPPPFAWKAGLFVDVFFQDAWWEAVLLDDVVTMEENAYVNVMYPDEGDLARVLLKDLRISQLWDEVTGEWIIKGNCNLSRFLRRRGIARKEIMQTTSTNQDDLHQICSVQSKSKLKNGFSMCSAVGLPGGNVAGGALLQDMTYYVQARAAPRDGNCNGDLEDSCSDELSNLDQPSHENCISQEHLQSSPSEAARVDSLSYTSHPDDLLEDTGCLHRSPCEDFESLNDISNGVPCSVGTDLKHDEQAVQASIAMQQCIKEFSEAEARVGFETVEVPCFGQLGDQTCISQEHLQSSLSETDRVDSTFCASQPDSLLEDTRCIHRNMDESNAMQQCSKPAEAKFSLEIIEQENLGQLGDANQEPLQSTLPEATSCPSLPDNLLKNTGCLYRSACECSEISNNVAKPCSDGIDIKDSERAVNESHVLQQCSETFSEAVVKVSLETVGHSNSGQFGTKNLIFQEPLQSATLDIGRVDDTSCTSLQSTPLDIGTVDDTSRTFRPDNLLEITECLHNNACEGSGHLKCFDTDASQCSEDRKVVHESNAMQLCIETVSKTEEKFKLETGGRSVSQFGNASQELSQLTCIENSTVITPSSNFLTNNLTMTTGSPCRIELVEYEGPQCAKRNNIYVEPRTDSALYQGNGEAVCKVHSSEPLFPKEENCIVSVLRRVALEHPVETSLGRGKVVDSAVSRRSGPETGESPCGKEGESLAFPAFSSSNQGEEDASLCVKQVCPPDVLENSHSLVEPKSSTLISLLPIRHPSEELTANICKVETGKSSSTGGGFVDCKRGSDSQQSAEEVNINFGERDMKKFTFPAYLATSSSQGQAESMSDAKEDELGCSVGQFDSGGSASPANFMDSSTQSQQTEESDKLDYLEERSVNRLNKYSCDRPKRHAMNVDSIGSRDVFNRQTSGSHKGTASLKTQEIQATGYRMKRKATDEPQERVVRTGLRDKHHNQGRLFEGKIERRLENDTLMSFRDRLVLQKQADALKRKAMESGQGEKNEKRVAISSKQGEKNEKKVTTSSKQNTMELIPISSLTTSMVKDKSLKLLTRDIAKEALVEAGFRIDLRPRRSRDYKDSVYVSPDGHAYWSLPKAWDALKRLQAEKSVHIDGQGSSEDVSRVTDSHEKGATSSMSGEEYRQSLATDDRSALKEIFSRFGDDERLQSALTKRGACSGTNLEMAQNVTRQADMTNADLTDILLEDLGVLRRFTQKFLRKQRSKLLKSTDSLTPRLAEAGILDEKRGIKRKQDSITVSEISERNGRGSAKKSHGVSFEDKKQGPKRSLKQTMLETKATVVKHKNKKGEKPKARSRLEVRQSSSSGSDEPACHSTRTVFAWMIDRGAVLEREKIFFVDEGNHQAVKEGVVTREGILCSCCKRVFTVHSFEAHAGSNFGDWHQALVFTSGKRLLDRQLKAWDAEIHLRRAHNYIGISEDDTNDDTCLLCGDGGDLICCDGCPSTFHASCLQIDIVPDGDWYCPKCSCGICDRRQRGEEKEDPTVIVCNQCEHRCHIACLHGCHSFVGKEVFCTSSCEQIFSSLRGHVGISHSLPGGFSWTLLRCMEEDNIREATQSITQIDCHSKLAVALLVIKECFNPMVDPRTNVDMITHAMYNRWSDFDRLNYAGFYTAVLEKEGEIISVATIRIHGVRLAEMPLIGTREKYRRQGMCRLLVGIIEKLLSSLKVAFFILPAIPELFDTWTLAFGFKPLDSSLKSALKGISMMVFPGTELLQKPLSVSPAKDTSPLQDTHAES